MLCTTTVSPGANERHQRFQLGVDPRHPVFGQPSAVALATALKEAETAVLVHREAGVDLNLCRQPIFELAFPVEGAFLGTEIGGVGNHLPSILWGNADGRAMC